MSGNPPKQTHTSAPSAQSLAELLAARPDLSVRALAKAVGVSPSHLSRVIRGADGKRPSLDLLQRLAQALGVPTDYFIETRTAAVIAVLKTDAGLTDNLYGKLGGGVQAHG
jgi:transcriptional regulator with XRE-family HTH domain